MLRACLVFTSLALGAACAPDGAASPGEPAQARDPAHRDRGDHPSHDPAAPESAGDASPGEAAGDASTDDFPGDASDGSGDASTGSGPDDAGDDASGGDGGDDASAPDASEPDDPDPPDAAPPHDGLCTRCGDCEEVQPIAGASHIDGDLDYPDKPPTGGDHNPCWTTYGVHEEPVPDQRWVHNLEHGAVVFLYNCPSGCPNEVAQLRALVEACGIFAVLTPYELMPKRFAAVSWGHRLASNCLDIEALRAFYDANVNHGSESNPANPPGYCIP